MESLNPKQIGNLTEMKCMLAFMQQGYNVLTPYGDCERYDFVADIKGQLVKIQCKTSRPILDGEQVVGFIFCGRSSNRANGGIVHHKYSKKEIDLFATIFNDKCYLVPVEECGSDKRIRLTPPKNNQARGVNLADNYELEEIIKQHYN